MGYTDYNDLPLVLSVIETGKVLGIGKNSAYELVRCGKIRSVRIGHQIRIPKDALIDFLKQFEA